MTLDHLVSVILSILDKSGYVGLFILSAIESCAIPIPSEVVLPFSGFLVASGRFSMALVVIVATLGNLAGSLVLYWIGKSGRWIIEKYGKYVLISPDEVQKAEAWFSRHGQAAIFWSRMLPVIRTYAPLSAGITRLKIAKFATYTIVGSAIWNLALAWIGYKAGEKWDVLRPYFHKFDYLIVGLIVIAIAWYIIRHIKKRK